MCVCAPQGRLTLGLCTVHLICHRKIGINVETVFVEEKVLNSNESVKSFGLILCFNVAEFRDATQTQPH